MECKVQFVFGVLVILFAQSEEISISSNGHSPMRRMMTLDMKDIEVGGFVPINPFRNANHYTPTEKAYLNGTRLAVNERYRRLIPYMTFYLANNFNSPQTEAYSPKTEYQRVVIPSNGKLASSHYSSIPRYQGNRLSHFNIASAYPNKIIQDYFPKPPSTRNYPPSQDLHFIHNSPSSLQTDMPPPRKLKSRNNFQYDRPIPVPVQVSGDYFKTIEPPQIQFYTNTDTTETKAQQHYKLVPYEQTPPVPVPGAPDEEDYFVPKANPYTAKPANIPAKSNYQQLNYYQSPIPDKQYFKSIEQKEQNEVFSFTPTAENQYNKNNQNKPVYQPAKNYVFENPSVTFNPVIESGFKPMVNTAGPTPQAKYSYPTSTYNPIGAERQYNDYTVSTQRPKIYPNSAPINTPISHTENPEEYADISPNLNYEPESDDTFEQNNLAKILKSLQKTNSLPKTLTPDNIDSSIKTLVQILNNLKTNPTYVESSTPLTILSSPVPFKTHKPPTEVTSPRYKSVTKSKSIILPNQKPLPVHEYPPQDLDKEHPSIQGLGSNRDYLADENELGGTPGKPGIDYPILSAIPATRFDCKTQRYKGFFGDPETNCQVWHYCDLNGGQASFLCPNGTIFSQVALTCDWWFNVKCDSTAQLYVLNERLYKYILPYSPKFPEDYSGPLVDKYLTIKYKELEEKMKKQKKGSKPKPEDEPNGQDNESADMETEKAEIIEISTSGMTGALKHYQHQPTP